MPTNAVSADTASTSSSPAISPLPSAQTSGGRVWAGTSDAGVWLYQDGSWIQRSNGIESGAVTSLEVNPFNHDVLLAVVNGIVYRTEDAG
jgi:hypothetical protein